MPRASRFPVVTLVVTILVAMTFLWVLDQGFPDESLAATPTRQWIYLNSWNVWSGGYWALLTAPLANVGSSLPYAVAHLALGLTGLWVFGRRVELALGSEATAALLFFGALASSACALAAGAWPVLGSTGMACALVGSLQATRPRRFFHDGPIPGIPEDARKELNALGRYFDALIDLRPRLEMSGWLAIVALCALSPPMFMSNIAHMGGWALGYCVGKTFDSARPTKRRLATVSACAATLMALAALTVMALAWMPWNADWRLWRGVRWIKAGRVQEALDDIEALTRRKPDWPEGLNAEAWTLSTSPRDRIRDGRKAIDLARRVCELTRWRAPEYIDTLAAAYAEAGQWSQALQIERQAMTVAQEQGQAEANDDYLKTNLRSIEEKHPIRD
jgi:membrane associated rhomboid family serine protease